MIDDAQAGAKAPVIRLVLAGLGVDPSDRRATALTLTYRIAVEAGDAFARHRLMTEIAFALTDLPVLAIEGGDSVPIALKPAAGDDPLGLILAARLVRARRQPAGPPVLRPLVVQMSGMGTLDGSVATPEGGPVAGALVEIPSLDLRQTSLPDGRFRFAGLPAGAAPFTVIARKRLAEARANARPGDHLALILSVEA